MSPLQHPYSRGLAAVWMLVQGVLLTGASPAGAEPPPVEKTWEFEVTPYLWLPHLTGEVEIGGFRADIGTSFWDVIDADGFAIGLMARMEAWRKRRFGLFFDGAWMYVSQDEILKRTLFELDASSQLGFLEVGGMYRIFDLPLLPSRPEGETWQLDALVGARVNIVGAELDFKNLGSDSETRAWADPFLGGRVMFRFGPERRWSARARGDVGGFGVGSDLAWNVLGGIGYDFRVRSLPVTALLAGRALSVDFDEGDFAWDVIHYGPVLGMTLHF